jgi:hypothetical protein
MFNDSRDQAFRMGIMEPSETVIASMDSTFIHAYSIQGVEERVA